MSFFLALPFDATVERVLNLELYLRYSLHSNKIIPLVFCTFPFNYSRYQKSVN